MLEVFDSASPSELPLSRSKIAALAGRSRRQIGRVLADLEQEGRIRRVGAAADRNAWYEPEKGARERWSSKDLCATCAPKESRRADGAQPLDEFADDADPFHDSLMNDGIPFLADRECVHGYFEFENRCSC